MNGTKLYVKSTKSMELKPKRIETHENPQGILRCVDSHIGSLSPVEIAFLLLKIRVDQIHIVQ